jgi:hypothetical protein
VPSDRDVRTLLLRRLHFDLLKEKTEHPRVVHLGEKHPGESRDVLRGEECVDDRLGEVVEVAGGLARSAGVIRKITSTVNLVPKGGEVKGACGYASVTASRMASLQLMDLTRAGCPRTRVRHGFG